MSTNEVPSHLESVNSEVQLAVDELYDTDPTLFDHHLDDAIYELTQTALENLGWDFNSGPESLSDNLQISSNIIEFANMCDSFIDARVTDSVFEQALFGITWDNLSSSIKFHVSDREVERWSNP